jgi:hypothetical protein
VAEPTEAKTPKIVVNRPALKVGVIASLVVITGLVVGLLAQDGLFSPDPGLPAHPDGLTTLALVLAVLAFLVQIFVFVVQTNAANSAERRSEHLNIETQGVLGKIEADSTATKEVLISQFNRLLDYVVDGRGPRAAPESVGEPKPDPDTVPPGDVKVEVDQPVTARQLERILGKALAPPERPTFEVDPPTGPSPEDEAIIEYLQEWPGEEEMKDSAKKLSELPSYGVALLTRYGIIEIKQRLEGVRVGLVNATPPPAITSLLIAKGLFKAHDDGLVALTEQGRELARSLPIGKETVEVPVWLDEVVGLMGPQTNLDE